MCRYKTQHHSLRIRPLSVQLSNTNSNISTDWSINRNICSWLIEICKRTERHWNISGKKHQSKAKTELRFITADFFLQLSSIFKLPLHNDRKGFTGELFPHDTTLHLSFPVFPFLFTDSCLDPQRLRHKASVSSPCYVSEMWFTAWHSDTACKSAAVGLAGMKKGRIISWVSNLVNFFFSSALLCLVYHVLATLFFWGGDVKKLGEFGWQDFENTRKQKCVWWHPNKQAD